MAGEMKDRTRKSEDRSKMSDLRSKKADNEEGYNEFNRANTAAIKLLSLCDRTNKDLKDRLLKKGYSAEVIKKVISGLEYEGYINDELFAYKFTYDAVKRKNLGPEIIRDGLQQKGISREIIDAAIEKIFREYDEKTAARLAINKKLKFIGQRLEVRSKTQEAKSKKSEAGIQKTDNRREEIKKLSDYLRRKGFSYDIIRETIRDIEKEYDI